MNRPMRNSKPLDGENRWPLKAGKTYQARDGDTFFVAEQSSASPYYYAVIRNEWKLVQVLREDLYTKTVENLLFNIVEDPSETTNLAAEQPERVELLANAIARWAAQHPVGGQHVEIAPNPGWLPPKDWADAVIPAEKLLESQDNGFEPDVAGRLDQVYKGRGRVVYE